MRKQYSNLSEELLSAPYTTTVTQSAPPTLKKANRLGWCCFGCFSTWLFLLFVALLIFFGYLVAGAVTYQLTFKSNTADAFWITQNNTQENVPCVIVIHGYRGCRKTASKLAPAGMLFQAGYNVLVLDLLNHGSSQQENGYVTFGYTEHLDVLGGFDFISSQFKNVSVGLYGVSMGAATALITYAQEPKISAGFADSPPADVYETIFFGAEEIVNNRFFASILMSAASMVSRTISSHGFPPFSIEPLSACSKIEKRPLYLVQGYDDQVVPEFNTIDCLMKNRAVGGNLVVYFGDNGIYENVKREGGCDNHVTLIATHVQEYREKMISFFDTYMKK